MFLNTREVVGSVVAVNSSMKLISNNRKVNVRLSKKDLDMLDDVQEMFYCPCIMFEAPEINLQVQVTSDTFRGGLEGKLLNLKEWYEAHKAAYSEAWVKYTQE